jgi:hypothetical protein
MKSLHLAMRHPHTSLLPLHHQLYTKTFASPTSGFMLSSSACVLFLHTEAHNYNYCIRTETSMSLLNRNISICIKPILGQDVDSGQNIANFMRTQSIVTN